MEKERLTPEEVKMLYEIYTKYGNFIFATALKILQDFQVAEDCIQNVLLKLGRKNVEKLLNFSEEHRKRYIYAVVRNTALDMLKKTRREIPDRKREAKLEQERRVIQEEVLVRGSYGFTADRDIYLQRMDVGDRKILGLKYCKGLTGREIAERLHKPIHFITQRASRARKKRGRVIDEKHKKK